MILLRGGRYAAAALLLMYMNRRSLLKKWWSYLFPTRLRSTQTPHNPVLELWFARGRYVLSSGDAVYSDGEKYRPVVAAFKSLGPEVQQIKSLLLLGCGLASTLHILAARKVFPDAALVDVDATVLDWALEFLPAASREKTVAIRQSASDFVAQNELQFSLVVSDVFNGRFPLSFVSTDEYLQDCYAAVAPGGFFILNYIAYEPAEAAALKEKLHEIFGNVQLKNFDHNYVFIARA